MDHLPRLLSLLAPPRCLACRAGCPSGAVLCASCATSLDALGPPAAPRLRDVDEAWAAAPHEGVARELVVALKFRRLLSAREPIAERIAERAPRALLCGAIVPVPPASSRLRGRGFDPAEEIAGAVARLTGLPVQRCLSRADGPRQVGRSRAARLAAPPRVRCHGATPRAAVLVDDVQTTGATLSACARALRRAGAQRLTAVTFARSV